MISVPLNLQSIHDKEFKRNLHTAGSCSLLSECSLGIHSMFSLLYLTVNVHHKQPQQVMDFRLFLLALYLLWDNFLISEMTSIHVNNIAKKTPWPQSVHSLGMLGAENATLPQLHNFWLRTRCKWDMRFLGGFYAASIVSCRRFGTTVGGGEIPTAVLVKIQVIWDVSPCQFTCIFGANSPRCHISYSFLPS